MTSLLHILIPITRPTPFLSVVGFCFAWSAPVTVIIVLVIRFGWRRGKGLEDP